MWEQLFNYPLAFLTYWAFRIGGVIIFTLMIGSLIVCTLDLFLNNKEDLND